MKCRKLSALSAVFLLTTFLAGCGGQSHFEESSTTASSSSGTFGGCITPPPDPDQKPVSKPEVEPLPPPRINAGKLFSAYEFFDPYYLNESVRKIMPDEIYQEIMDRFCGMESEFHLQLPRDDDINYLFKMWEVFPFFPLGQRVTTRDGFQVRYKYDEKEHRQKMFAFADKVEEILAMVTTDADTPVEYALSLYRYLSSTTDTEYADHITIYNVVLEQQGSPWMLVNAYSYLLGLLGVETQVLPDSSPVAAVKLDGKYYIMDLENERYLTKGSGLSCFGLLPIDRTTWNLPPDLDYATDDRFAPLQENILAWTFGEDGSSIMAYYEDADEPVRIPLP